MARIGVIGGGAFGTAMACVVRRSGHDVTLWAREPEVVAALNADRANPRFLPGVPVLAGIVATGDLAAAASADFLLLAPPAQHVRSVTTALRPHLEASTPVVACSKGIERGTCALMSEVIAETLPETPVAVLSGPSFAAEIGIDLPTAVALACADRALGDRLARDIENPRFRLCVSDDLIGAQLGGVLKNVVAIACGIVTGRKLGSDARSMLVALGLGETVRLGLAMGARLETFLGLAGIADMDLSCHSPTSRNMSLGIALGQGRKLAEVLAERVTVQEGVHSAAGVAALAGRHGVEMPVAAAVDRVLNHGADMDEAIGRLLAQPAPFDRAAVI
ncbi:MAG: NAD(P)-dependent glycerol-3-phosphate dehydrogenase [Burkholderiales bacterium]|nr:NAD(P)-dependent glycerol-3-phosphate dehydrogenase [Burkholderiales bacterium]